MCLPAVLLLRMCVCTFGLAVGTPDAKESNDPPAPESKVESKLLVPQSAIDHVKNKNYEAALPDYRKAVEENPDNNAMRFSLCYLLRLAGRLDESIGEFREAIRREPEDARLHQEYALVLVQSGAIDHAIDEMKHAIALAPQEHAYSGDLGGVYLAVRQYANAIENLSASLTKKETSKARLMRAVAYYKSGKYDDAVSDCDFVLKDDSRNHEALACRGYANLWRGEYRAAQRDAEMTLETGDQEASIAEFVLGVVRLMRDEKDLAIQHLSKSIQLRPNQPLPLVWRALAYHLAGDVELAIKDLDATIATASSPQELNFLLDGAGWEVYKFRGILNLYHVQHSPNALRDFNLAIELNRDDADCIAFRGWAHSNLGKWKDSLDDLNRALEINPDHLVGILQLVHLLSGCPENDIRDGQRALAFAKRACKATNWDHSEYIQALAAAYSETGDFVNATYWQNYVVEGVPNREKRKPDKVKVWGNTSLTLNLDVNRADAAFYLKLYEQSKPYRSRVAEKAATPKETDLK